VSCTTNVYAVGGNVDGLAAGSTVGVRLDGGETLALGNGPFAFATTLASGANYAVDIAQQPDGQNCTVGNASGTVGGADVAVAVHCAALPPHLVLAFDSGSGFARYGQVVDYTVTLNNDGSSAATQVSLDAMWSDAFDRPYAHWQCFGAGAGATCAPSGDGALHDVITLPPGRNLTWRVSVPVRADTPEPDATFTLALGGAQPASASDTRTLVILRDGFDVPYADGARIARAQADAILDGDTTHAFALPPPSGERLDTVLAVHGGHAAIDVQRTPRDATTALVRLLRREAGGEERVTPWVVVANGATLTIGSLRGEGDARVVLLEGGDGILQMALDFQGRTH
jgi:hypothetical protein